MDYEDLQEHYFQTLDSVQALLELIGKRESEINSIYGRIEKLEKELERKESIISVLKGSRGGAFPSEKNDKEPTGHENDQPRALVVDPMPRMRLMLKDIINSAGYKVVGEAQDTRNSLAQLKHCEPDLVVLNARLGSEDGLNALKEMRKIRPDLKAIVITDGPDPIAVLAALEAGVADILPKPINRLRLHELVKSLVHV